MSQQPRSLASTALVFLRGSDPTYREKTSPLALIRLLVLVSLYYAIGTALFAQWPAWRSGYQSYFRGFGNVAFEQFLVWPTASVRFLDLNSPDIVKDIRVQAPPLMLPESFPVPQRDKSDVKDTLMLLKNVHPSHPGLGQLRTGSRLIGYWPTVTMLALALATPWKWTRKIWLVVWGMLLVHVFVVLRLSIYAFQGGFAVPEKSFRLVNLTDFWFTKLKNIDAVINDDPTVNFIAPVLIWLMVLVALELWHAARPWIAARLWHSDSRRGRSFGQSTGRPRGRGRRPR